MGPNSRGCVRSRIRGDRRLLGQHRLRQLTLPSRRRADASDLSRRAHESAVALRRSDAGVRPDGPLRGVRTGCNKAGFGLDEGQDEGRVVRECRDGGSGGDGETRTRTSSEALPSGGPRFAGYLSHGETRTRTGDTTIFSRVLYQLSYLAVG